LVVASALFLGLNPVLSTGQELIIYPPATAPVVDADPSVARPLAVGPVATGAANVNLSVSTTAFASPMDFFLGVYAPSVLGPSDIFLFMPDNSLQPLSVVGVAPWRSGVTQVNESLFGNIPSNLLPAGMYNLFFMATPAGNHAIFTLWQTWFGAGQVIQVLGTNMSGAEAVPNPVVTPGVGVGDLTVVRDTNEIASTQRFSGLTSGIVASHIHIGAAGANGPVIVEFQGPTGVTSGTWSTALGETLLPAEIDALLANGLYYQIHTPQNPGGELRGQIISSSSPPPPSNEFTITTQVNGGQAVPAVATPGTGTATSTFNTLTGAVSGSLTFSGLTGNSILAHVHIGAAGTNGPVILDMVGGAGGTSGTWTFPAGSTLTPAEITALQNDGLYYQVHSSTFPGGEIRGQIIFP
jgi:hypothetical protein